MLASTATAVTAQTRMVPTAQTGVSGRTEDRAGPRDKIRIGLRYRLIRCWISGVRKSIRRPWDRILVAWTCWTSCCTWADPRVVRSMRIQVKQSARSKSGGRKMCFAIPSQLLFAMLAYLAHLCMVVYERITRRRKARRLLFETRIIMNGGGNRETGNGKCRMQSLTICHVHIYSFNCVEPCILHHKHIIAVVIHHKILFFPYTLNELHTAPYLFNVFCFSASTTTFSPATLSPFLLLTLSTYLFATFSLSANSPRSSS